RKAIRLTPQATIPAPGAGGGDRYNLTLFGGLKPWTFTFTRPTFTANNAGKQSENGLPAKEQPQRTWTTK
ncbi:unnamed protein product, partial [marine sediment metagenome]